MLFMYGIDLKNISKERYGQPVKPTEKMWETPMFARRKNSRERG